MCSELWRMDLSFYLDKHIPKDEKNKDFMLNVAKKILKMALWGYIFIYFF